VLRVFTDYPLPAFATLSRGHVSRVTTTGSDMAEKTINLRGLKCPLPALRARKALTGLKSGDLLIAECTDPLTAIDIPNLLNQTGDKLESSARDGEVLVFRIRKK
jgi:tRNA 2-thiouridine synthesizing protein A